ncbi:SNF1-interacting protein [Podila epicladia]|nr:SNF1-interacting protein [Podila epicladia]
MGNASTKDIKADQIDGGGLVPNGIYTAPQDYDFRIVQRLILQRKLAPFYKGLEDCDDSEDAHEEKLKLATMSPPGHSTGGGSNGSNGTSTNTNTTPSPPPTSSGKRTSGHGSNQGHGNVPQDLQSRLYQGAVECPICFLYYPRNINRTRCCDKPMCTECFVQLKRLESAPTESPACPYCVEPHFGILYSASLLPTLPGPSTHGTSMAVSSSNNSLDRHSQTDTQTSPTSSRRRSTSHKHPEVVAADDLRPDWNRRILAARQPGSRRASTSSSVSGATFALGRRLAGRQGSGSRRSNSAAAAEYGYLSAMRHMGTDLEELMIIEAMRQSIQDENERQAREAASGGPSATGGSVATTSTPAVASPSTVSLSSSESGHNEQTTPDTSAHSGLSPVLQHATLNSGSRLAPSGSQDSMASSTSRSPNVETGRSRTFLSPGQIAPESTPKQREGHTRVQA